MMNESVSTIMIKNLITLTPENTLAEVSEIFNTRKIHHIPIVNNGVLVGLITTYDLWRKNALHETYPNIKVGEVMSKKLIKLEPEDKIGTAAELFLDNRFHALPVVQGDVLVGLVTTFDVLKYSFKKEYPDPILYKDVFEKESEKE
jgi:CBS domain-containing protein